VSAVARLTPAMGLRATVARAITPSHAVTPVRGPAAQPQYVHPGQIVVSDGPDSFVTILGSCVAVLLHDPKLCLGGLNHYLLPQECTSPELSGRYGPSAIAQLIATMYAYGASPQRLVAHVVGGASVLAAFHGDKPHLGIRNIGVARELLALHRIPIVSADVGGTRGRKLAFSPRDGLLAIHMIGQ
jgi:chemotaxis receptor (MCP) glutamine deamidase CheD